MTTPGTTLQDKVKAVGTELKSMFVERDEAIDSLILAVLSRQHILLLGPPGTAKGMIVKELSRRLHTQWFQYQLSEWTTREELFGPISIKAMTEQDTYRRVTTGKLPHAELAMLDETFLGSRSILTTLLRILQERRYENDGTDMVCPLISCIGASNQLPPEGEGLEALYDRFLIRLVLGYLDAPESVMRLVSMKEPGTNEPQHTLDKTDLDLAHKAIDGVYQVIPKDVAESLAAVWTKLREVSITVTDRRLRAARQVMAAYSWLNGETTITPQSLVTTINIFWQLPEHRSKVRQIVLSCINIKADKAREIAEVATDAFANVSPTAQSGQILQVVQQMARMKDELTSLGSDKKVQEALATVNGITDKLTAQLLSSLTRS